jgi:hypothetical protein
MNFAFLKTACCGAALLLAALAIAPAADAVAQTAATPSVLEKPLWKELSRPQQVALEPLAAEWDRMDSARKQKWIDIANRYSSMKPDEQQRVQERMRDWLKLTPEERRVVRQNYTMSKKIDKSQKASQWEQYQQLPEEEKRKLAAEAAIKKQQITNLPPKTQPQAVTPSKPVACPAGSVRNANPAGPACVPGAPPVTNPVPNAK